MKKTHIDEKTVVFDAGNYAGIELSFMGDNDVSFHMSKNNHVDRSSWAYDVRDLRTLSKIMTQAADELEAGMLFSDGKPDEVTLDGVTYVGKV